MKWGGKIKSNSNKLISLYALWTSGSRYSALPLILQASLQSRYLTTAPKKDDGHDYKWWVPITFAEAALGADIAVPTLDGGTVKMRIPAGTGSGKTFRLRGKGGGGDLLVTAEIAVPGDLSAEQKAAVEAYAAASNDSPRAHLGV